MENQHTPLGPPGGSGGEVTRERIIEETRKRTGITPHEWQVANALDRLAGKDTLTIAPTGSGKSLTIPMVSFMVPKSINWVLAPLNIIQEQQMDLFNKWEVPTICINQTTNWTVERPKILHGKYKVVVSSPEAFLDSNKLRKIVMAKELSDYKHYVVVDEAHVIKLWGPDFRKAYARVGNLRAMLFGAPFAAMTATATQQIRAAIITSLHLGSHQELVVKNLGSYRKNIRYEVYKMKGGLNSYQEVTRFFASPDGVVPTLVFTDSIADTHAIAHVLRNHLGWTGELAGKIVPYHANRAESGKKNAINAFKEGDCKIIVATEALTMGCDFANVELMLQFGAPSTMATHGQRSGRTARRDNIRARAVMMVTNRQYQMAVKLATGKKDVRPDDLLVPKEEEGFGNATDDLEAMDNPLGGRNDAENDGNTSRKRRQTHRSRVMDPDVAQFIATQSCRVKVLDSVFDNPPHDPCYEHGNCDICVDRRARDEAAGENDLHASQRAVKREELDIVMEPEQEAMEPKRKKNTRASGRMGKELDTYKTHLKDWRARKFIEESKTCWISLEEIATDKALEAIAKSKDIVDIASLDALKPLWPQRSRWGEEIVSLVLDLSRQREEEAQAREEASALAKLEEKQAREAEKQAKRIEKQASMTAQKEIQRIAQEAEREGAEAGQRQADELVMQVAGASHTQYAMPIPQQHLIHHPPNPHYHHPSPQFHYLPPGYPAWSSPSAAPPQLNHKTIYPTPNSQPAPQGQFYHSHLAGPSYGYGYALPTPHAPIQYHMPYYLPSGNTDGYLPTPAPQFPYRTPTHPPQPSLPHQGEFPPMQSSRPDHNELRDDGRGD